LMEPLSEGEERRGGSTATTYVLRSLGPERFTCGSLYAQKQCRGA